MFLQISGSAEHQMAQRISPPYFAWGIWGGSRLIKYHLILRVSNILIYRLCMGFKMMLLEWKVQAGAKAVVHPIRRAGNPLVGLHVRRTDYIKKVLLLFLYNMIRLSWKHSIQLGGQPVNSSFYGAAVAELQKRWGHLELLVVRRLSYKSHILISNFKQWQNLAR